jgi:hypothetical protein
MRINQSKKLGLSQARRQKCGVPTVAGTLQAVSNTVRYSQMSRWSRSPSSFVEKSCSCSNFPGCSDSLSCAPAETPAHPTIGWAVQQRMCSEEKSPTSRSRCAASTSSVILPGTNQSERHARRAKSGDEKGGGRKSWEETGAFIIAAVAVAKMI